MELKEDKRRDSRVDGEPRVQGVPEEDFKELGSLK